MVQLSKKMLSGLIIGLVAIGFTFGLGVSFNQDSAKIVLGTPAGYSATPCTPLTISVPSQYSSNGIVDVFPASVSYHVQLWHTPIAGIAANTNAKPDVNFYICNQLVVNAGLDWLAKLDGQNNTGSPVWMTATTGTTFAAGDTACQTPYTSNGFTHQNAMSTYAHTGGTSTYTIYGQWTYTGSSATTLTGACLDNHSASGVANYALVDETALGSSATVNANGDILKVTATVTV